MNTHHATEYDLLFTTCQVIGKLQKIKLIMPNVIEEKGDLCDFTGKIAEASGIRVRKVNLQEGWWKKDSGPLLSFYNNQPCALLPKKWGGYQLVNVRSKLPISINEKNAQKISNTAFCFYTPLPTNIRTLKDFCKFSLCAVKNDFWLFAGVQVLVSLLILATPIAFGFFFNTILPNHDTLMLYQILALLIINILVIFLCRITQAAAGIRMRFKLAGIMLPAIWDKLLKLPLRIYRRFSAGDLNFRIELILDIQNTLIRSLLLFVAGVLIIVAALLLLIFYSAKLALAAIILAVIMTMLTVWINDHQMQVMRKLYYHFGRFVGFTSELIAGISKIRVTHAIPRVFDIWTNRLAKRSEAEASLQAYLLGLEVYLAFMTIISSALLFGLTFWLKVNFSFGDFIAFFTAYSLFFLTLTAMIPDLGNFARTAPLWKRSRIIFIAKPEHDSAHLEPGPLTGDIALNNIVFRYHPYERPLFTGLSLRIHPGEFVAVVGPSGSGKSTLFRLILGFEKPEAGEIYFNNLNLRSLKILSVRRQIGVVIQNSSLIPGTIFANIAGHNQQLSRLDAWEVSEKVGLSDFIKNLPMQMDTLITEGAITLSGGEVQRLILARALVQKPKIIILDEATSALDNTTQAVVHNYLKQLHATQIIAAHRLSTIINADRIIVIDQGKIVQTGTFSELMSQPGLFAQMAKRQL